MYWGWGCLWGPSGSQSQPLNARPEGYLLIFGSAPLSFCLSCPSMNSPGITICSFAEWTWLLTKLESGGRFGTSRSSFPMPPALCMTRPSSDSISNGFLCLSVPLDPVTQTPPPHSPALLFVRLYTSAMTMDSPATPQNSQGTM